MLRDPEGTLHSPTGMLRGRSGPFLQLIGTARLLMDQLEDECNDDDDRDYNAEDLHQPALSLLRGQASICFHLCHFLIPHHFRRTLRV
jgi:hypothetical protein